MTVAVLIALVAVLVILVAVVLASCAKVTSEGFLIAGYTNLGPEDTDGPSCVLGSCCQ